MLEQIIDLKIPQRTIIYLILSLLGILALIFLGIIPYQNALSNLDKEIQNIQFQLEEQKIISTLHQPLVKKAQEKDSRTLPMPLANKLSRGQQDQIASILRATAGKSKLDTVSIAPDLGALTSNTNFITMNIVLRGNFLNFRKFLIGLGEIQSLERTEEIHIQQNQDKMEFIMRIRFAVG